MKTKSILVIMFIEVMSTLIAPKVLAQQRRIDSLFIVLKTVKADTLKVNILNSIAYEYRNNDPDTAIYFANTALTLSTKINYTLGMANAHLSKGTAKTSLGEYEEAFNNLYDAIKLFNQIMDSPQRSDILKQKGKTYNNIGNIYYSEGYNLKALKNHFAALKIYEAIGNKKGVGTSYNYLARIYYDLGNFPEAMNNALTALENCKEIDDKGQCALSYVVLGSIYDREGNFPKALENYFKSLKLCEEIGDTGGIAGAYNNIGNTYEEQENSSEAMKNHLAALKLREKIGNKRLIASSYNNIGNVFVEQNNYSEALKNYFTALKIREEINDKDGISTCYNNIANIYGEQGNDMEALKYYFKCLKIKEEFGDVLSIAITNGNIGSIYLKHKEYNKARKYYNLGLKLSKQIRDNEGIQDNYRYLSILDSTIGNFRGAYNNYKMYAIYYDSLFNEENTKKTVQAQLNYEFDKKEAATRAEQDKKDVVAKIEFQKQKKIQYLIIGIGSLLIVTFILGFFNFRNRKKKEAAELNQQLSVTEMKALRSQMNPHFIFNCVHTIQELIKKEKVKEAGTYLEKFSNLTRSVLDNSEKKEILLKNEIETLLHLMELEKLRNSFAHEIIIEDGIDPEATLIPPLILQPFVENSIKHGFSEKSRSWHLKIEIKKESSLLICMVEDNGIGRKESLKIDSPAHEKSESKGMKLTEERLQLISKVKKIKSFFKIDDLADELNNPSGTRVKVFLPLELLI